MSLGISDQQYIQYSKQMLLADFGEYGQQAVMNASVVIIGLGGLGQLVAQYLSASGMKQLYLFDGDVVDPSNLPRQILFDHHDIGKNKAAVTAAKLQAKNADGRIIAKQVFVSDENHQTVLDNYKVDMIIDCSDNFNTRHLINKLAIKYRCPLVSAAISADHGQYFMLIPEQDCNFVMPHGCYHCLYPADTYIENSCQHTGVLGPAVGVLASMQALAVLNYLSGRYQDYGVLHRFDAKGFSWSKVAMTKDEQCPVCQNKPSNMGEHEA
ncbi:HesA/MoeB/ThiF family protein [Shewanella gaetbuli]|uniref:HesA/MoeB/ThiF family protein n=1 Tax=Shewanella gaetbuli TaxID=220752 RepID=A0A9X1ZLI1_9GAMM|nr:HesA/MoeB/ThiF family protein [Shewanella gaetbuli]MCL1143157.1 HesA/MoeB/ThiF family protein [Shewanella gaetbuli]